MTSALQKIDHMPVDFSQEKLDLLKNTVCKGSSNDEFQLFLHVCKKTGLDPFMKQIYSIPRGGTRTIQTSIDGMRLIADRTHKYSPGKESTFTYDEKGDLISATSYIKKMTHDGTWHDISATALVREYIQPNNPFWKKMQHTMTAKCAEAIALRKAFPAEMSGLYSDDEMQQAEAKIVPLQESNQVVKMEELISSEQLEILNRQLDQIENGREDLVKFLTATKRISDFKLLPRELFLRLTKNLEKKIQEQLVRSESGEVITV